MLDERIAPTKEEKWVDGQALRDFGIGIKEKINKSVETRLDKGSYIGTADNLKAEIDGKLGVKNKAESSKESDVAGKLKTPVNINGVAFDGSSSITVEDSTKTPKTEFNAYKEEIATSKLDSGGVSLDYNSAKKIEDKIKALENRPTGDFLEKGGYTGTAQTLKEYTDTKVAGLVNSAPSTLDTLKELSDALGNDPNFATTVANQIGNKLDKGNLPPDWNSAEKIKGKVENGLIFKGTVRQTQINSYNTKIGVYDIQEDELVSGLDKYWSVLNFGEYTNAKTQIAFPYQFGVNPEMYLRTSSPSGWKNGGWKRVWHDGNFDPNQKLSINGGKISNFILEDTSREDTTIKLRYKNTVGGIYKNSQSMIMYNAQAKTYLQMYDDGRTTIGANNLKTRAKEVVAGINELKDRFENSPVLYEYNGRGRVTNLSVPRLSAYRMISIKYQVGVSDADTPQNGRDITQTIMYMDDVNKHFHLFDNGGRVRYTVEQNKLIREYEENATNIVIRKIYGLVEK